MVAHKTSIILRGFLRTTSKFPEKHRWVIVYPCPQQMDDLVQQAFSKVVAFGLDLGGRKGVATRDDGPI